MALWLHSQWGETPINTRNQKNIGERELSVNRWNQVGNPPKDDVPYARNFYINSRDPCASNWLYGSDKWNKSFPEGWEAVQVLGTGGFGIAGHWHYTRFGPHKRGAVEAEVRDIVVKQANSLYSHGLISEAEIMELLTMTGSRHIPQIYGRVHRDVGQQDGVAIDQKRREVHRIFMEYCEGGSLSKYIENTFYFVNNAPEDMLWAYFHCFAKAMVVMERGHELASESRYSSKRPWVDGREVVHFDIKPDNALITTRESGEHVDMERVVISDFGLSATLPNEHTVRWEEIDGILQDHEFAGTVAFRAPEQRRTIQEHKRRYGSCTNIFQVGCIMYCIIMQRQVVPYRDPPAVTPLTGLGKGHRTAGGSDLEIMDYLSKTLRGLVAECLFLDPMYRPTAVQLLERTRQGLRKVSYHAATASKLDERLTPVPTLLLDKWFEKEPGIKWPERIPEMQRIVDRRRRQLDQVERAQKYPTTRRPGPGPNPAAGGKPSDDEIIFLPHPPGGPDPGEEENDNQPGAPPETGATGTGEGQQPLAKTDPVAPLKSWPGVPIDKPIDILNEAAPKKSQPPAAGILLKKPEWDKVLKNLQRPPKGHVPRPQKRPSQDPAAGPDLKKIQRSMPGRIRQMDMVNIWIHDIDLNREGPAKPPPQPEQSFLIPVRIWRGPTPSPADEAVAKLRTFRIPATATIRNLMMVMRADPTTGVEDAIRCGFSKPGMIDELDTDTLVADLGYGPAPRVRMAHLECYRTRAIPGQLGPGGVARSFRLTVHIERKDGVPRKLRHLVLQVGYQMTIERLKVVIIENDARSDFKHWWRLRIRCAGPDPMARDCLNERTIKSFFEGENDEAIVWCSLRNPGQPWGFREQVLYNPVYTPPPRYRNQQRFL